MRSRLFVKIYLTLIACLAAVAVASGIYWGAAFDDDEGPGWSQRRDRFLAEILPPDADIEETRRLIERVAEGLDADIALYAPDGSLIASGGDGPAPAYRDAEGEGWRKHRGGDAISARLADGRIVAARMDRPWVGGGASPLLYLALIAGVIAAAAYPVVRHMTRRLEALRDGVERFGAGTLSARAPVSGRDEVAAVARSFNAAADRIEKLIASHRSLLANASHELRSPVARLRMAVDMDGAGADEARRREIEDNLAEIDQIVEEILLASRLDHIERLERTERVDLLALTAEEGARHGVDVTGEPAEIMGDARLLTRLARNLMINALKHGGPPVTADVEASGGVVRLSVRDHGPGIPEAERERIFEPFYRPSGRSERAGGWGLGLSLVRQIAGHHGATVRVEPVEGGGSRFVVEFAAAAQ
ncbi:MAG: HAMP domain-containing histidine kinase [Rhizobiaceae bacterium]|nr:HAMP domain-containing histidine kinase [Rhizobiaceae bacterium]MCV0405200.1 HAMP domain-containing histidine kinase [Rhizobiaceae bacterium]